MAAETVKKNVKQKLVTKANRYKKPRSPKTEIIIKTAQEHPDLTTREIGAIADCSHVNVVKTLERYGINQEHLSNYKERRADILAGVQHRLLVSVTDADIQKTPVGSRILAVAQLYDKERLERGQSTSNISYLDENKRLNDLIAQRDKIKAKMVEENKSGDNQATEEQEVAR